MADEHDVGGHHDGFGKDERLGAAETGLQHLTDGGGGDEADGVGDEDQGDDGVAYLVLFFHIGDESTGGCVVQTVAKIHETSTQEPPLVDWRVRPGLHDFGRIVMFRARWAGHLKLMETSWCLGPSGGSRQGRAVVSTCSAQLVELKSSR